MVTTMLTQGMNRMSLRGLAPLPDRSKDILWNQKYTRVTICHTVGMTDVLRSTHNGRKTTCFTEDC
jgi:hypothetical protein